MSDSGKKKDVKVQVFKIANRLKMKLGLEPKSDTEGFLAPEAIEEADKLIEALCKECPQTIAGHLKNLGDFWTQMREMPQSPEREQVSDQVYTTAHEIKDIGAMCGYDLIAHFAESLRDYIGETELNLDAQRVIIQAHLDAMNVVHKDGVKDDAGPMAEELKKMVAIAIEKYK